MGLLDKQDKKDLKSLLTALLALVFVTIFGSSVFGTKAILDISNDQKVEIQNELFEEQKKEYYKQSISHATFAELAAEASTGLLKNLYVSRMNIGENKVEKWRCLYVGQLSDGLGFKIWQNVVMQNEYCLVFAGTDQLVDTKQYFSMLMDEVLPSQIQEAVVVTRNFKTYIGNAQVDKLFIVGHSLGGYISAYIATEIIQYELQEDDPVTHIDTKCIADDFDISKLQCITFGGPGIYYTGTYPGVSLTNWQRKKIELDQQKKFDPYLLNYVVKGDPVGNLLTKYLGHLGVTKILSPGSVSEEEKKEIGEYCSSTASFNNIIAFLTGNIPGVIGTVFSVKDLYYHMPWVYVEYINQNK